MLKLLAIINQRPDPINTGGVLTQDQQWHAAQSTYLFPVKALSRKFRGKMVSALRASVTAGQLNRITRVDEVDSTLNQLMQKDWVVYSKPSLNHADSVIGYLARYSHRIAISDQRLIEVDNDQVRFHYKDYRNNKNSIMPLQATEFIRRFLMHVLPGGFMRIRHYGLLANRCRQASLSVIRQLLSAPQTNDGEHTDQHTLAEVAYPCTRCRQGLMLLIAKINPCTFINPLPG